MKFYFIISLFVACSMNKITNCPKLSCDVIENDKLDSELDSEYGEGDDDLFTADEPTFYILKSNKLKNISSLLNDYNLQTSYFGQCKNTYDTLCVVFNFKGLIENNKKPVVLINEIDFFNGNRKNLGEWKKSKKIKEIEVRFRNKCIGEIALQNTYKMQIIKLGNGNLAIYGSRPDTLKLIIKSVYQSEDDNIEYSISEIKFSGLKYY